MISTNEPNRAIGLGPPYAYGGQKGGKAGRPRTTVGDLVAMPVSSMTRSELKQVVDAGRLPETTVRLECLDRPTLERLAHRARLSLRYRE